MSQVYTRTVKALGDADTIFDRMWSELRTKGFNIVTCEKPNLMIGERGTLRITRKVNKYPHSLVVAFHTGGSNPFVSFSYIMGDLWDYTQGDQDFFNQEINSVISSLNLNASYIDIKDARDVGQDAYLSELRSLAKLREDGVITAAEFDHKKRQIMGF